MVSVTPAHHRGSLPERFVHNQSSSVIEDAMPSRVGPWWSHTAWGRRTGTVNIAVLIVVALLLAWATLR